MNWSKTKTIFIICFLLLDLFLGYQLYERQVRNENYDNLVQNSAEDILQKNNIKIDVPIPDVENKNITFLKGRSLKFVDSSGDLIDDLKTLEGSKDNPKEKITAFKNGTLIEGTLSKPVPVPKNKSEREDFLNQYIYKGSDYSYWKLDEENHMMLFVQKYEDKPVFIKDRKDINILQLLISDGKVTGYRQTYFKFKKTNQLDIINPTTAINNLWSKNVLPVSEHPKIKKIQLGYYNLVGDVNTNQPLIFVPVWYFKVKTDSGQHEYFVNAVSGSVQPTDDKQDTE
ncbi:regulatory protein YycI of two-component signal transduction system YycFG [Scopulibacillus daqui]|uniref:Regulatory protein YycI of two-component signal transduction system YycFG n=1 Tax=Scopulibacillus daqui TaxID=1469162 RepID=A0ABS2Q0M5_9BACL|nr:two-component system regulatory protein YycI [Scopulibacillus daqui]MBM7645505.1 regulatory protein YycI of two-component signal transduction system YycFG [Scopulibacillus daqui]